MKLIYGTEGFEPSNSYDDNHTEDECDKCGKIVGKKNLKELPFLFLDRNDHKHFNYGNDYHLYCVCKDCYKNKIGFKNKND